MGLTAGTQCAVGALMKSACSADPWRSSAWSGSRRRSRSRSRRSEIGCRCHDSAEGSQPRLREMHRGAPTGGSPVRRLVPPARFATHRLTWCPQCRVGVAESWSVLHGGLLRRGSPRSLDQAVAGRAGQRCRCMAGAQETLASPKVMMANGGRIRVNCHRFGHGFGADDYGLASCQGCSADRARKRCA